MERHTIGYGLTNTFGQHHRLVKASVLFHGLNNNNGAMMGIIIILIKFIVCYFPGNNSMTLYKKLNR